MNFTFSNLLGGPYRGGTLLIQNNELLIPIGNRVVQVNLTESTSKCLPFENLTQIRVLCVSPDGNLLMSVDKDGRALLINRKRQVLLHHFSFKHPVACARFSPDGQFLAVGTGRLVQIWQCPSLDKTMNPMQLHRTFGQCHSDVLDVAWSPDGAFIAVASRDITLRIFSREPIPGYDPPTLTGHKEAIVGVFFANQKLRQGGMAMPPLMGGRERGCRGSRLADGSEAPVLYSLAADGALHAWRYEHGANYTLDNLAAPVAKRKRQEKQRRKQQKRREKQEEEEEEEEEEGQGKRGKKDKAAEAEGGAGGEAEGGEEEAGGKQADADAAGALGFPRLAGGKWYLASKHYFHQRGARVSSYDVHSPSGILAVGFSNGIFDLYQLLPEFTNLHTLSVSRERITSLAFNHTGDWLGVGCAALGQLLVWEWRSETYVLKQQGHTHDIATVAFSPDGALIATGADDCKVKVFQQASGFCFVTFSDHTAPVTALTFLPSGHALLSASLDGTVRAWDLVRYRNFRTLTSPTPVQYGSLAVDPAGEVVCAGTVDTFQIFVWSLKTGRLLDVLAGHEGPVAGLAFSPVTSLLASVSWDRTARTWDVYDSGGSGATEVLEHRHDVLAVAMRPDGRQMATAALDGSIYLWDPVEGQLQGTIEGRRDIRGGRLQSDRRTAGNSSSGAAFTSLAYSADGAILLAGGNSKYVCVYDVAERLLLRRFQLSHNRSLDGVLDQLNSRNMTDAGPLQLINHDEDDDDVELLPPTTDLAAAANVPGTSAGKRPMVRCRCVALSPTGRLWAAATTEGLMLYGMDESLIFDPTDLTEDLTPAAAHEALRNQAFLLALVISLRLRDPNLVRHVLLATPPSAVQSVSTGIPAVFLPGVLSALAESAAECPHLEFLLRWIRTICTAHGAALKTGSTSLMPVLRSLQKVLGRLHGDLAAAAEGNMYALEYLSTAAAGSSEPGAEAGEGALRGE